MAEGDWNYPVPTKEGESGPLPDSLVPVPDKSPSQMLADYEANGWPDGQPASAADGDPLAGLTSEQVETAHLVTKIILGDDPYGFAPVFDQLSHGLQNKVFSVMAKSPHLRGLDLVDQVERKLTLEEAVEAKRWLVNLSVEHKTLVRDG